MKITIQFSMTYICMFVTFAQLLDVNDFLKVFSQFMCLICSICLELVCYCLVSNCLNLKISRNMFFFLHFSDPSSLLGVRLPPDTEIIKYTSSIVGPKIPGTTNRGRKKTISLDPNPLLAGIPGLTSGTGVSPAKRARLEAEYGMVQNAHQSDRVEVIKLPPTINSNGAYNLSKSSAAAVAVAAAAAAAAASNQNKDLSLDSSNEWATGLNLSGKASTPSNNIEDGDAPLNLCMKSDNKNSSSNNLGNSGSGGSGGSCGSVSLGSSGGGNNGSGVGNITGTVDLTAGSGGSGTNSLQSLSSITAALGSGSGNDRK